MDGYGCSAAATQRLLSIQHHSSPRKMRLIAAAFVRHIRPHPECVEAKACDDLIEATADEPRAWEPILQELHTRPGHWRFTHVLLPHDPHQLAKELRKLLALAPVEAHRVGADLVLDVVADPSQPVAFDPGWRTETAVALARQMYEARDFAVMPVLADALVDAGCDQPDILSHCRGPGPHARGCWVVDLVLGKS